MQTRLDLSARAGRLELHHPNRRADGSQRDDGGGNGQGRIQGADRSHVRHNRSWARSRRSSRPGGGVRNRGCSARARCSRGCGRCWDSNRRGRGTGGGRTAWRQSGKLDRRGRGWLRRQIDTDRLFLGLDLARFLLRWNCPCRDVWYVVGHNAYACFFKSNYEQAA